MWLTPASVLGQHLHKLGLRVCLRQGSRRKPAVSQHWATGSLLGRANPGAPARHAHVHIHIHAHKHTHSHTCTHTHIGFPPLSGQHLQQPHGLLLPTEETERTKVM